MAAILWLNVLLTIPFLGLWAGIPLWLVLRHPDAGPAIMPAPAGRVHISSVSLRSGIVNRRRRRG